MYHNLPIILLCLIIVICSKKIMRYQKLVSQEAGSTVILPFLSKLAVLAHIKGTYRSTPQDPPYVRNTHLHII
jgi:hypothetical protein